MALTYTSYLKIEELLNLQQLQSPNEHDETLFIIIHQAYELWFKQILHETDRVMTLLEQGEINRAQHSMKRILTILKVLVHQVDILETMTPLEFLSFRDYLESASGFQSYQWRELEFVLGRKSEAPMLRFPEGSEIRKKLEKRYHQKHIWRVFLAYLKKSGHNIPEQLLKIEAEKSVEPSEEVQQILVNIYRTDTCITQFCELMIDLDEGIQEWRYRHVKMVERTIGYKTGTGGSPGVEYLRSTLFNPLFPDLWAIRSSF
ncbi:MAG: tryptophan 2,3-dioxygenase family protein [Bacteroidales bacterium]|nr:tryptophan 2,3-dioxygenase family protein [Bacteroidales bacterium]